MSRAERWKVVRIPAALAERIEALAAEMLAAHIEGRASLPNEVCERVPAHHIISRALDDFEGHRERSRKPARRSAKAALISEASSRENVPGEGT